MKENDIVISVKSFFCREPSHESIQAIEDTICYSVSFDELNDLYKRFPLLNLNGRLLTTHYYILSEERLYIIRKQKAFDRYKYLIEKHPEILFRAPIKYIASYLGINTETLSRIRGKKKK